MNGKKGEMLSQAILLATNAHNGVFDKGGQPYILHPLRVMYKLQTKDEELQCIALLHDVVEDCDVTYIQLRELGFSGRVIEGVRALTKTAGESYEEYKEKVFANADAMLVKMQDLRHNADLRRMKGVSEKDIARSIKYILFFKEIEERINSLMGQGEK